MSQTTTMTTAGPLLKELLTLPPVRVLNDKSFLHDKLTKEQAEMDFSGKYVRYPVQLRRAIGGGSRAEGGLLPVAVAEDIEDAKVYMKYHYFALEWSEALEEATKNKEGAFEKIVTMKMSNLSFDMAKGLNRQWYNLPSGALAVCTDTAAGLTITVDDTQYIQEGDNVDITTNLGVPITNGTARSVVSVNRTTKVVTLDTAGGNVDPTATSLVMITGNYGNEIDGLRAIGSEDRSLYGIDSTTYTNWDGKLLSAAGQVIGESLIERIDDKVGKTGRGDTDLHLTTRGIRRRLADEFASQRRYLNEKATDIKAGYRIVEVNGRETVIDDDCPHGEFFAVNRASLKVLKLTDPGFIQTEAGDAAQVWLKDSTTSTGRKEAVWQTQYRYHCTLVGTDPSLVGRIKLGADDGDDE